MANLTIKNIPEALVEKLKAQAAAHRRSLNHEVIRCLECAVQSVPLDADSVLVKARGLRQTPAHTRLNDKSLIALKKKGDHDCRRHQSVGVSLHNRTADRRG